MIKTFIKTFIKAFTLTLIFAQSVYAAAPEPISGIWKHSEKMAWLEFSFKSGLGHATVLRHEGNTKAKGLLVLKDIKANDNAPNTSSSKTFSAKMYSADVNGFIEATMTMEDKDSLVITINHGGQTEVLRLNRALTKQ